MKYFLNSRICQLTVVSSLIILISSCGTSKNYINYSEVQTGNHLDKANEIKLDTFLTLWMENTRDPREPKLTELYKDSSFTYFGRRQNLYKLRNDTLSKLAYKTINGDSIKEKFYYEVIPLEDREKWNKCGSAFINPTYKYAYIENKNSIEISCHYKVKCELIVPMNKLYRATYNIDKKSIRRIE